MTPGCVYAASEILHNISPNWRDIDPCEDFHAYVCEGWDLRNDLREDQSDTFTGTIMNEESQLLLRHVLESSYDDIMSLSKHSSKADEENFEKMQDAYNACMAESIIKKQRSAPLLELLEKLEEIFPVDRLQRVQDYFPKMNPHQQKGLFYSGETPLSNAISYLMSIGVDAMLSFGVSVRTSSLLYNPLTDGYRPMIEIQTQLLSSCQLLTVLACHQKNTIRTWDL